MLMALRLVLNLLLALLVSLFGSAIVLSSRRRPNAWLWGAVFGLAICFTMIKPVMIQPGWLFDFRAVVIALSGFAGGLPTYLTAASIGSLYRLYLGGRRCFPRSGSDMCRRLSRCVFWTKDPCEKGPIGDQPPRFGDAIGHNNDFVHLDRIPGVATGNSNDLAIGPAAA
jgi:hypothetical protein